ncbi:ATP-binding protein [Streptomyces zingiberis]|uniref:ATP-binding protein n=1 Tax=Streptomyces zingiberis TaxID=2053010 RepID=A0ABX1BSL6_9ACTN|nr:ATP-binding protein [Streptomyces zingiberis]NJQ00068.1 ATP-binding protein [Streptomyces zingiberis]
MSKALPVGSLGSPESPDATDAAVAVYRTRLVAVPERFAVARRSVGAQLRLWGYTGLIDAAAMCVTELLANVHRHVSSHECGLALHALPEGVRVSVSDRSSTLPVVPAEPDWHAERGRGLFLLSCTADAWGAEPTPTGKEVWALLRSPLPPPLSAGPGRTD